MCAEVIVSTAAVRKALAYFTLAIGCFPPVPLLYRWKHFEQAASFCLRGLILNRVLVDVLLQVYGKSDEDVEATAAEIDEDDPDASFAQRQKVRVGKTVSCCKIQEWMQLG